MKFVTVKQDKQLALDGVTFNVTWHDNSISEVVATDAKGNAVRFAVESYSFRVGVLAPPKMVKRFRLVGTVLGMPVDKPFDERHEAEDAQRDMASKVYSAGDCELSIEEVEVPEEVA